jgi:hypothetical protein
MQRPIPPDMASQLQDASAPSELFETANRNRPQRTYSHKGRNRSALLPALKPSRNSPPPVNKRVEFEAFRVGRSNSWELIPVDPVGPLEVTQETGGSSAVRYEDDSKSSIQRACC